MPGSGGPLVSRRRSGGAPAGSAVARVKVSLRPYDPYNPQSSFSRPASAAKGESNSIFRSLERSVRAASGCSARAFSWWGQACAVVAFWLARSARAAWGSKVSCSSRQAPAAKVAPRDMVMPAVQKKGWAVQTMSSGLSSMYSAKRQLWITGARWKCRTPFGWAVVPDV